MIKSKKKWIEIQSRKMKLPANLIERAFTDELTQPKKIDDPLEIPDRIQIDYKYSYGLISRFFREIRDHKRIYGTQCKSCGTVFLPPRAHCAECYCDTEWVPCGAEGTVKTFTVVYYATSAFFHKTPFVCAFILLDGADTLIMSNVIIDDVSQAKTGMRVKVIFKEHRLGDLGDFYFVPI
ncbi:MAG: Zn-ribbon domain-containing OB-fold protein [bacterium]